MNDNLDAFDTYRIIQKWRQLHLSRQLLMRNTRLRAFRCWRTKLREVDNLETLAEGFEDTRARRMLENAMQTWSRRVQMRDAEKYLADKVSYRIMKVALKIWIRVLYVAYFQKLSMLNQNY